MSRPTGRERADEYFDGSELDEIAAFIAGKANLGLERFDPLDESSGGLSDDVSSFREDNDTRSRNSLRDDRSESRESANAPTDMTVHSPDSGLINLHEIHHLNFLDETGETNDSKDETMSFLHSTDPEWTEKRADLVKRMIDENADASHFEETELAARFTLEQKLGMNSPAMKTIRDMVDKHETDLESMANLLKRPSRFEILYDIKIEPMDPALLELMLKVTAKGSVYTPASIDGIQKFARAYKGTAIDLPKIIELSSNGVAMGNLAKYIEGVPSEDTSGWLTIASPARVFCTTRSICL